MSSVVLQNSFSAGELTPEIFGRIDLAKRQEGLALCRNFITLPHGPAVNRPGTEYVSTTKNYAPTRLISFTYSNTQTFAIELGAGYFRFHTQGQTLLSGGVPYEVSNPYLVADLFDIHYVQSGDVLTLTHPNYPPMELNRLGALSWTLTTPVFTPPVNPITSVTATATVKTTGTPITQSYVVTTVLASNLQESAPSTAIGTCSNDLTLSGNINTITWSDPSAAGTNVRYYVYKLSNGLYGYIGMAQGTTFLDKNITPDMTQTPPISDANAAFTGTGNYPAAVGYYQQRRCFAGTINAPQSFWATRSGTQSDMSYNLPLQDSDRISIQVAARQASAILHIVPTSQLLMLTGGAEWLVAAPSGQVLTPSDISVTPQSYIGASNVTPQVVANLVLYAAACGGHVRELSYSWQVQGYVSRDICLLAPHLFDYSTLVDMAYVRGPIPILWTVSSNGTLLGMTYVPDQQLAAWHHHDTGNGDKFESCCVVTENNEDMLYVIVNRTINGTPVRYVERLHTRLYATLADAFYVDCGATFNSGSPVTTISGLTWLNGMTVNILADGAVMPARKVVGGSITLDAPATKVTIGLPITAQLQTMPSVVANQSGEAQGYYKQINKIWVRVYRSSGVMAGGDFNSLVPYGQRTTESYGAPPNMVSSEIELVLSPSVDNLDAQVCIQQNDPLPLDISSITVEIEVGG